MRPFSFKLVVLGMALATPAVAQTVTVTLSSPQNGQSLSPGATVNWTAQFTVSVGDNAGLALLAADLAQDNANPAYLDIPPADSVPAAMANFSRPAGICNEGESNPTTGYTGVQRGTAGRRNLVQVGGAQNTFGQTLPPSTGVAQNSVVTPGVGQSGAVVLASGSFAAPAASGNYVFRLQNVIANVLTGVNAPPVHSPVIAAPTVDTTGATISFSVVPCIACDVNCSGTTNGSDIQDFVARLLGVGSGCSSCAGDMNNSGSVTSDDIALFVSCLINP